MKIIEMTATFGLLNKAALRPGDGFTLIEAPNESGKSTWCAFLRAMLYGFPARDRSSAGYIAEKTRYQPWSGAAMEGSVTLEWKGRELTLYRGPKGTAAWGAFTAVWTATNEPVEGLTGENCGEVLLGVSREVFERTAFVGQGEAFLSPSADLEKRIAALATSGEEEVSFSQVERRLKDWLNRRKVNSRVGLIPELEQELSQIESILSRRGKLLQEAQQAQQEKEALEGKLSQLEAQLQAHTRGEKVLQAQRRRQAQEEYNSLLSLAETLRRTVQSLPPTETLRQAQGDLHYLNTLDANLKTAENAIPQAREKVEKARWAVEDDPHFAGLDSAQAAAEAQADCRLAEACQEPVSLPLALGGVVLAAALGALLRFLLGAAAIPALLPWAAGGAGIALLAVLALSHSRKKRSGDVLAKYAVDDPEDIPDLASSYAQKCAAVQDARRQLQAVEEERDKLSAQKEELTARLLELVQSFAPEITDLFGVSAALSRALQQGESCALAEAKAEAAARLLAALPDPGPEGLSPVSVQPPQGDPAELSSQLAQVRLELSRSGEAAARLQGELKSLGDGAELEERRSALLEQLEKRQEEYAAITAALDALRAADSTLREKFSPAVNEKAGEYLSALTDGKYETAALTRQFQALAREPGEPAARQDLSLSTGAAQQLYLALRLAMCDLALPEEEPCPILLDDVLDAFDDRRAKLALDCLSALSKKRQVLLFTCHSREKEMLKGADAKFLKL